MAASLPLPMPALMLATLLLGAPSSLPSAAPGLMVAGWEAAPALVAVAALEPGANSITERQARRQLAALRLHNVRAMRKDARGFWRGRAWHAGAEVEVAMDFRGHVAMGAEVAALDQAPLGDITGGEAARSMVPGA